MKKSILFLFCALLGTGSAVTTAATSVTNVSAQSVTQKGIMLKSVQIRLLFMIKVVIGLMYLFKRIVLGKLQKHKVSMGQTIFKLLLTNI